MESAISHHCGVRHPAVLNEQKRSMEHALSAVTATAALHIPSDIEKKHSGIFQRGNERRICHSKMPQEMLSSIQRPLKAMFKKSLRIMQIPPTCPTEF